MYKVKCFDKIAKCGLDKLGNGYVFTDDIAEADVALVRSSSLHEIDAGENLFAVARAGAGVNNIPVDKFAQKGIVVFNTPGANANGVKELVIAALLLSSRDVIDGVNWVRTIEGDVGKAVEKGKKAFAGKEIAGKKLGVIGLGAIGVLVANSAISLGMTVYGYDVNLSIEHALALKNNIITVKTLDEMFAECDYITVHVPLLESTKYLFTPPGPPKPPSSRPRRPVRQQWISPVRTAPRTPSRLTRFSVTFGLAANWRVTFGLTQK